MNRKDTRFVYTVSSRKNMVEHLVQLIQSLKNYVDPEKIVVFYTNPIKSSDWHLIKSLDVDVRRQENTTPSFAKSPFDKESYYSEKINLCRVDAENVVFLDCDTVVLKDIWPVLQGSFDIKARPGLKDIDNWESLFEKYDRPYHGFMPNTGFLVFKNRVHKRVRDDWTCFVHRPLEDDIEGNVLKEQYALALASGSFDWVEMSSDEHVFGWSERPTEDTVVLHKETSGSRSVPLVKQVFRKGKQFIKENEVFR